MAAVKLRGMPGNLITAQEWADATGYSKRQAYNLMQTGALPYRKHYGFKRIVVSDIEDVAYHIDNEQLEQIKQKREQR